ncbi:MAG TPA: hypothetical protein VFW93_02635 [Aquabacterium sp.]|uniref:hypothetical protein n=1 Tax=Aquabacterium sp. TaxID=1872578 RepID=UPI002E32C87B|nr:hypothetical protein [Aquabacterium sp.]HEX5355088.1 hypothetical protein [Aquabacterium sp.]
MGAIFRLLALLLIGSFAICMVLHTLTGEAIWRQRAMQALKWGVVLGLSFFGLFILRRAAVFI